MNETICRIIAEQLGHNSISPEDSLVDLGADSLERAAIYIELENACGVDIPGDDSAKFVTVGDIVHYIEARVTA